MYSRMANLQDPSMESALKDHFARVPIHSPPSRYPMDDPHYRLPPVSASLSDPLRNIPLSIPDPVLRNSLAVSPPLPTQPIRSPPPTFQHPLSQVSLAPITHTAYEEPRSVVSRFLDDVNTNVTATATSLPSHTLSQMIQPSQLPSQTQPSQNTASNENMSLDEDLDYEEEDSGPLPPTDGNFDKYVEERLESDCGCGALCFSKFPFQAIYDHILDVREMGKYEKDLYVMSALSEREIPDDEETAGETQRTLRPRMNPAYRHCGEKVCRATFMMLYDVDKNTLDSLKKVVETTPILPRSGNLAATSDKSKDDDRDNSHEEPNKKRKLNDFMNGTPGPSSSNMFSSPVASTSGSEMLGKSTSGSLSDQVSVALNEIDQMEKQGINGGNTVDEKPMMPGLSESEKFHRKMKKGCGCKLDCLRKFPPSVIYGHILDLREMSRVEKEIYILVALAQADEDFEETTKKGTKRLRVSHSYWHMGNRVCRYTFMLIYDIGKHCLENLQKHLATKGIVPRIHASKGKKPWHAVTPDDCKRVCNFVNNFTDIVGSPQPGAPKVGPDNQTLIMLPAGTRKKDTWKRYTERCLELSCRALKYSTFITIWNNMLPHIKCPEPEKSPQPKREIKPSPTMVPQPSSIDPSVYDNRKMDPVINMQMYERKFDANAYDRKYDPANLPVYDRKL